MIYIARVPSTNPPPFDEELWMVAAAPDCTVADFADFDLPMLVQGSE